MKHSGTSSVLTESSEERDALVRAERPNMISMKLNGPRYMIIYSAILCCGVLSELPSAAVTKANRNDSGGH